jgi:hypothetical protein
MTVTFKTKDSREVKLLTSAESMHSALFNFRNDLYRYSKDKDGTDEEEAVMRDILKIFLDNLDDHNINLDELN